MQELEDLSTQSQHPSQDSSRHLSAVRHCTGVWEVDLEDRKVCEHLATYTNRPGVLVLGSHDNASVQTVMLTLGAVQEVALEGDSLIRWLTHVRELLQLSPFSVPSAQCVIVCCCHPAPLKADPSCLQQ